MREYVLSFEGDEEVAEAIGRQLSMSGFQSEPLYRALFAALAMRWLSVGHPVIAAFTAMIQSVPADEPSFQRFIEDHPQLLDPLVMQVWPQPNIHGAKIPDFVVRRRDDSYLVVEIECPAKPILTEAGQLSHQTIHAVTQAQVYRNFLRDRKGALAPHSPNFQDPDCLVVIGREEVLSHEQAMALRSANREYHGLKIVGFDWLAQRADAVLRNLVENVASIETVRIV